VFKKSLSQGDVPSGWREANIVPIFKKGSKTQCSNYRPVALTSVCCKVLESILRDDIVNHLEGNKLLNNSQHGFRKHRSCTTNLIEFMEFVTAAADKGEAVNVVYLDFSKAFDKVPVKRLLEKIKAHGIQGEVLRWVTAWLTGRRQRVVLGNKKSSWKNVLSGVPQGSVLGPILFNIFINDIDEAVRNGQLIKKFADDTKVAQIIRGPLDRQQFQATLERLLEWSRTWAMPFNVEKCHIMHVGRGNPNFEYSMGGQRLGMTEAERDVA